MGLFLHSYSLLTRKNEAYKAKADEMFQWLLEHRTKGYDDYCWGYNFDWASPVKYLKAFSPTIVVSGFVAKGVFEYYKSTQNPQALKVLESIGQFVWNCLERTEDETGICISYSTKAKDACYNASMLGAELYAKLFHLTGKEKYKSRAIAIANFTVARQHSDGHWKYSIDVNTGKERHQVDFHQGYVLDSLQAVVQYAERKPAYIAAINKGLQYYRNEQFFDSGKSKWRVPKVWPVEIHNQSQGIITFSRLSDYDENHKAFANTVAQWTINNMQHRRGYFFYKKYPLYSIKTPFIRWGQAWMLLALTELMQE